MARLLSVAAARGIMPAYAGKLLTAFAKGLSNQEIGERLFLALDTIKGHKRRIFDKLDVKRRTEAIARGRELGLL